MNDPLPRIYTVPEHGMLYGFDYLHLGDTWDSSESKIRYLIIKLDKYEDFSLQDLYLARAPPGTTASGKRYCSR